MTDTSNMGPAAAAAAAAAPPPPADPGPPPAADGAPVDYKAYWEQEKAERIRERNLYRPVQRIVEGLDPEQVAAIQNLAEMARAGDVNGIVDWSLETATNLTGADLASIAAQRTQARIAGQQQPPAFQQPAPQQPSQGGFNVPPPQPAPPANIEAIIEQKVAEAQTIAQIRQQVTSELNAAGYSPDDAFGQAIIRHAQMNRVPVAEAITWFNGQLAARQQATQQALAAAAGQVPAPAPTGAPAGSAPSGATTRDKIIARVEGWGRSA